MQKDTKVQVTLDLINGVLQYLGTRPYQEVFALVQEIHAQVIPQVPTPTPSAQPAPAALND